MTKSEWQAIIKRDANIRTPILHGYAHSDRRALIQLVRSQHEALKSAAELVGKITCCANEEKFTEIDWWTRDGTLASYQTEFEEALAIFEDDKQPQENSHGTHSNSPAD